MSRRVYLPLVLSDLPEVARAKEVSGERAYAVTESARSASPGPDEEELEFDAMCSALDAATGRRQAKGERRVVVSADVPKVADPGSGGGLVRLAAPVPLSRVVSFHVEEAEGASEGEGYDDLLWYDVSELSELTS